MLFRSRRAGDAEVHHGNATLEDGRQGRIVGFEVELDIVRAGPGIVEDLPDPQPAVRDSRDPDAVVERPANPVAAQMNLLQRAFNQKLG